MHKDVGSRGATNAANASAAVAAVPASIDALETIELAEDNPEELRDIFFTNQKKGHVFRVKLNSKGFTLQRDTPTGSKEQSVQMCDIVGGRCMRLQKARRLGSACASCTSSSSSSRSMAASAGGKNNAAAAVQDEAGDGGSGDASAYLYVFAYVLKKKNLGGALRRERNVLTLRFRSFDTFDENMREAERWHRALQWHKNNTLHEVFNVGGGIGSGGRRRRLLVLLNPKSGSGKAREVFHQLVTPVLNEAELPYDLHVTKHANYARDFVRLRNLGVWCGIVAVGGDGLFYEILNGLLQRADWATSVQRLSLGIVPCGSGNGLARSIAHVCNEPYEPKPILGAALTIVSGQIAPMDVVRIELHNQQILYSFLSVGWGLISDVDIESERLRSLGYQRFTIWTLHRLICLRTYRGKITYLLKSDALTSEGEPEAYPSPPPPTAALLKHSRSCNTYLNRVVDYDATSTGGGGSGDNEFADVISLETSTSAANQSFRSRCDSWFSAGSRKSTYYSITESVYHSVAGDSDYEMENNAASAAASGETYAAPQAYGPRRVVLPPLHEAPAADDAPWVVEEGEFVMVHAAYQTHLSLDCFFAPAAKLNDATIYLVIIRGGISRPQLFNFLVNMSAGTHLPTKRHEFIKVVPVTAFRIEPQAGEGILTVDGERVEFGPLQGEMLPGMARVMVAK